MRTGCILLPFDIYSCILHSDSRVKGRQRLQIGSKTSFDTRYSDRSPISRSGLRTRLYLYIGSHAAILEAWTVGPSHGGRLLDAVTPCRPRSAICTDFGSG